MDIKTFVFLDSETTGMPFEENNKTRITELCFTAIQSDHLSLGVYPRIQSKVSWCFNPRKFINPDASKVTGLTNELLEYQPAFDVATFTIIRDFLNMQRKPVCLVAHNGNRFDYPILRAEIFKSGNQLEEDILCIDSLLAFRELYKEDILKHHKEPEKSVPEELKDGYDEILCSITDIVEASCSRNKLTPEDVQKINETTPKKMFNISNKSNCKRNLWFNNNRGVAVKKCLPFGKVSFKLGDIYRRLTLKQPSNAHQAEYDVFMLIECAATLGQRFVDWSNTNAKRFCDIPIMRPGKTIGY